MTSFFRKATMLLLSFCLLGGAAVAAPVGGEFPTDPAVARLAATLDTFWVLIAATLVMTMQIGFMLLEAGAVKTKNAVSVAQKNMLDFCFATVAFALLGFGIAFGSWNGLNLAGANWDLFTLDGIAAEHASFFIFQVVFCGTAATIISGAVAERMRLRAYIVISVIMAGLIYPVSVHLAWGAALQPSAGAWLANAGFVDFAGSTVVHATGGWFALAACIVLGPREGRFVDGVPTRIGGHSAVLSSAGALFLFVGWIGFNGGSTLAASDAVPGIILNTLLAGAAGGVVGYGLMWFRGAMLPERAINGMIAGLVAVTAGCHLVDPLGALILGAAGGLFANSFNHFMETRLRVDDAVGAVGVHAGAGVVGTLGLALLVPADRLPAGSHMDQLLVQATGSVVTFAWAFGVGILLILAIKPLMSLRVTAEEEAAGLNAAEHGARLGTDHIHAALEELVHSQFDDTKRLLVEAGDENEHLSLTLNKLMDKLQHAEAERLLRSEQAHDDDTKRLAAFGEIASEGIFLIHDGLIRSANAAAASLFSSNLETLLDRSPEDLVRPDMRSKMVGWLQSGDDAVHNATIIDSSGHELPVELRFRQIVLDGHEVMVLRMTDLSEREEARKRIYHLALHDTLTDLPNRELFNQRLHEALARTRNGYLTALLIIDVDRFKDINDLHGHQSGDFLLATIAERLLRNIRGCDTVARLGGDEFAIIYTNIAFPNQALDLAYRIIESIGEPVVLPSGTSINPRASIGLALSPQDAEDSETLFRNADLALYSVKNHGRNGYCRYRQEMGRTLRLRQELEEDLSLAVERGELELYYQPRVKLLTGEIVSFEALVRWRRNDELIQPADFIAIAEETGLIVPIGAWVIQDACRTAAQQLNGASISINVSVRQFQDPQLIEKVSRALAENNLDPSRLELEVTESVLIDDDNLATRTLEAIRELGVRVALDDFGTGYSSLSYLTRFRFDTIKIDRSFIQSDDDRTWHVIRSVLRMSHALGTLVVAEGVETRDQLDRLVAEGCNEIQGYYVSHPLPLAEAEQRWRSAAGDAQLKVGRRQASGAY